MSTCRPSSQRHPRTTQRGEGGDMSAEPPLVAWQVSVYGAESSLNRKPRPTCLGAQPGCPTPAGRSPSGCPMAATAEFMRSEHRTPVRGVCWRWWRAAATCMCRRSPPPGSGELAERMALARIAAWAGTHGWDVVRHDVSPGLIASSWIGAVPGDEFGPSHCVAMRFSDVEFDPASNYPLPAGSRAGSCHTLRRDVGDNAR